jgi:hypothetical protein
MVRLGRRWRGEVGGEDGEEEDAWEGDEEDIVGPGFGRAGGGRAQGFFI